MIRITTSHSAIEAEKYFDLALKTSDYYAKEQGTWGGKGAERLGLKRLQRLRGVERAVGCALSVLGRRRLVGLPVL
jgi:hypothetical protein